MLKGNLSSFSLGEIFQSLGINNHTGTLKISAKDGSQRCIYFSRGEISLFSSGSPESLRIGEILMRQKKLQPADLSQAIEEQKQTSELLGKILVRKGLIEKDDIRIALETKIREEIYDLFLLNDAEFEFHINHLPEEVFDPLQKNTRIAINTSAVIMEGLRRVDEWRLIQRRIKTFDELFVRTGPAHPAGQEELGEDLLPRIDGATPVCDLFRGYSGSRFECSKTLYELAEAGHIRTLTIEEAIAGGHRAQGAKQVEQALKFYRFADQLNSARVDVLRPMAACLTKLERGAEAAVVLRRALAVYHRRGAHREVVEIGEPLLSAGNLEIESAEMIFRSALSLGNIVVARSAGNRVLNSAIEANDFARAEEVLGSFCRMDPKDLNLRIELAELCNKAGDKAKAVAHLEQTAAELKPKKKYKELIKVLLLIFDFDPERQDVKQEVQRLLELQAKIEKRKKHRVTILGGCVSAGLLLSFLPVLYELKARELFSHAQRLEEISLVSNNFSKVKAAYEEVLRSYSFSTRAGAAREAIERVAAFERKRLERFDGERAAAERQHEIKLQTLREQLPELLREAKRLEEAGDIQRAFEICTRAATEFSEVPDAQKIPFPLQVTSSPKGAMVEVNGVQQGATPLVLRAERDQELTLTLSRRGCETTQEKVKTGLKWQLHLTLNRRPIHELKLSGPIQQSLDGRGDRVFYPSRDGHLYAVAPEKREMAWQRRMGRYGDLLSDLGSAAEEVLLGNVVGEVAAIARDNGRARWRVRLGAAVLAAPVLSPDKKYAAAATVGGEVAIIDHATGEPRGRFQAEDEVLGAPVFAGESLLVGSADRRLYELSVPDASPRSAIEVSGAVSTNLTLAGGLVLFATSDGAVHAYEIAERRVLWSRRAGAEVTGPLQADGERAYAGTSVGDILGIDLKTGAVTWSLRAAPGRVGKLTLAGGRLYAGTESGGLVAVDPATGVQEWRYKADAPIVAPPLHFQGRLYVACATGKILILEIVE